MEVSAFGNPFLSILESCYSFYGGSVLFLLSLVALITILPIPPERKPFPGFKLYGNLPGDPSFAKTKAQYATSGGTWIKKAYQQVRDPQSLMYPINNGAKPGPGMRQGIPDYHRDRTNDHPPTYADRRSPE